MQYVALPVISVALTLAAVQMRFLRSSLLDVLDQDFIRTARAKGLTERSVMLRHALKPSLIPFVTVVGLEFGSLFGGLVVVEQIFAWPGIGWLTIQAITQRDYAMVQGGVMLVAVGVVTVNFLGGSPVRLSRSAHSVPLRGTRNEMHPADGGVTRDERGGHIAQHRPGEPPWRWPGRLALDGGGAGVLA